MQTYMAQTKMLMLLNFIITYQKLLKNDKFDNEENIIIGGYLIVLLTSHLTKKAVYQFLKTCS